VGKVFIFSLVFIEMSGFFQISVYIYMEKGWPRTSSAARLCNRGEYTQRHPETTPLYKIVEDHYDDFKYNYDTKYSSKYGFFRPEISKEVEKYTECGIYNFGVARVVCQNKDCSETFFVPFFCRSAHFCPSCAMKNALDFEVLAAAAPLLGMRPTL